MRTIRIKKDELRTIVANNARVHAQEFQAAFSAWAVAQGDKLAAAIRKLGSPDFVPANASDLVGSLVLAPPHDHSDDYSRVLRMLDLSADDVIELQEGEYVQYVEDEWGWKRSFKAITSSYIGG